MDPHENVQFNEDILKNNSKQRSTISVNSLAEERKQRNYNLEEAWNRVGAATSVNQENAAIQTENFVHYEEEILTRNGESQTDLFAESQFLSEVHTIDKETQLFAGELLDFEGEVEHVLEDLISPVIEDALFEILEEEDAIEQTRGNRREKFCFKENPTTNLESRHSWNSFQELEGEELMISVLASDYVEDILSMVNSVNIIDQNRDSLFIPQHRRTVGVDFFSRLVTVKRDQRVKLQLWDTAGQERFRSITRSYYRNSVGIFLLYDVTRRSSFIHLVDWLFEAQRHIKPHLAVFQVVACKADVENSREISTQEGQDFADFYQLKFVETSAKTGYNVELAFALLAKDIYDKVESGEFVVQDGWDGIKTGFSRPTACPPLLEASAENRKCC